MHQSGPGIDDQTTCLKMHRSGLTLFCEPVEHVIGCDQKVLLLEPEQCSRGASRFVSGLQGASDQYAAAMAMSLPSGTIVVRETSLLFSSRQTVPELLS